MDRRSVVNGQWTVSTGHAREHVASDMSVTEVVIIPGFKLPTSFEFFNYAGIHWSVIPLSTSNGAFISDISTSTNVSSDLREATLSTMVDWEGEAECSICHSLGGWNQCSLCQGDLIVNGPQLWWPI